MKRILAVMIALCICGAWWIGCKKAEAPAAKPEAKAVMPLPPPPPPPPPPPVGGEEKAQ